MRFFKELMIGLHAYSEAYKFLSIYRLWKFMIIPILIHVILFITVVTLAWIFSNDILDLISDHLNINPYAEDLAGWKIFLRIVVLFMIRIFLVLTYLFTYKYLVLLIMAPVFAFISELTEEKLTGTKFPFDWLQFSKDVVRGMLLAIRNLVLEILWIIFFFVFVFIPIINLIAPFALFFIQSYFYGFSMLDYYLERRKLTIKESVRFTRRHNGLAIGIGMGFNLVLLIPLFGWFFAPILSAVAGTLSALKIESNDTKKF